MSMSKWKNWFHETANKILDKLPKNVNPEDVYKFGCKKMKKHKKLD